MDAIKLIDSLIERLEYGDITRSNVINKLDDIKGEINNLN